MLRTLVCALAGAAACWALVAGIACSQEDGAPAGRPAWRDVAIDPATTRSPGASPDTVAALVAERDAVTSPADGRGRAWLEGGSPVEVAQRGTWTFVYEAEAPGIALGGGIEVQLPFGVGWSPPKLRGPGTPGAVEARTDAPDVLLPIELRAGRPRVRVRVRVGGRPLVAGDRVRITYESMSDRSAEAERFWFATDGDGDGSYALLDESPAIETRPAAPARLLASWPSTARPGEPLRITVAATDAHGNRVPLPAAVAIAPPPPGFAGPRVLEPDPATGAASATFVAGAPGVHSLALEVPGLPPVRTNPLLVDADAPHVLWGDVHGHSNLSDGTGTPDAYYAYARDVAGLDVAALTDHDHFGSPRHLDASPEAWSEIRAAVARYDAPGRFVALLGFEWTSWLHGHRHVLYFGDDGRVLSSLDARFETPTQLWAGLRGLPALTFAHHPAGGPIAINWAFAPDPELEPLVEIVSGAGASEAPDAPSPVEAAVPGNFVRDALDGGDRLGFVGSGDSHDGHPGCGDGAPTQRCGLVAILAADRTREGVLEALRARRTYATNGARWLLDVRLDGAPVGAVLPPAAQRVLAARLVSPRPIARVDLVRSGAVVEQIPAESRRDLRFERTLRDLRAGEYVYLRAVANDESAAWSSPFFVADEPSR